MTSIEARLDAHGFLDEPKAWNDDVARAIAVHLGIASLSEEHFAVLRTLRRHYRQHRAILPASQVCREVDIAGDCIDRLFAGPLNAWRIAGLPDPGEEARVYLDNQTQPE